MTYEGSLARGQCRGDAGPLTEYGEAPDDGAEASSGGAADFLGCMVTDQGGIDDRSLNASACAGLQAAEASQGIEVKYVPSKSESDHTPKAGSLVNEDCGIIVTVGYPLGDATRTAANGNPDENSAIIDTSPTNGRSSPA